jgi:hypothetical protein
MTSLLTLLTVVGAQLRDRLRDLRDEPERGSLSVEQVIITVALIGIAVALVAVIANAVTSRSCADGCRASAVRRRWNWRSPFRWCCCW